MPKSKQSAVVSVIIPHYNGVSILRDCLQSLADNDYHNFETLIIDNGSTDGSQQMVADEFPAVKLSQMVENLGYAGGCNAGIRETQSPYILLLNNDTVVQPNLISALVGAMEQSDDIAAVQPKILSIQNKELFDYSGGSGGEIDMLGYPFVRGRLFDQIEKDEGQFEKYTADIFWASGTAFLLRRSVIDKIGMLDEDFFAHMEEIDWNWRAKLCGFRSVICTDTFLYHYSGYTLKAKNRKKMYLNHRNNLIMMLKNYGTLNLLWAFPLRLLLEMVTIFYAFIKSDREWAWAILESLIFNVRNFSGIMKKRRDIQSLRETGDGKIFREMYGGSIVLDHFLLHKSVNSIITSFRSKKS